MAEYTKVEYDLEYLKSLNRQCQNVHPAGTLSPNLSSFEGSATRTSQPVRLDLIPKSAITALGRRLKLGAERHGEHNWRSGGPEFRKATISHLLAHLIDYMENGNQSEANTDAIICNAAFLCEFEEKDPYVPEFKKIADRQESNG